MISTAEYVKEHIQFTIDMHKSEGVDLSRELGGMLRVYLNVFDSDFLPEISAVKVLMIGLAQFGELEERIERNTGVLVNLHEARKCVLPIYKMCLEKDTEGIRELREYADKLKYPDRR